MPHDDDYHLVTCQCCKTDFEGFADGQANGCASDISGNTVRGRYGSFLLDTETAHFLRRPVDLEDGHICDDCIQSLFDNGSLAKPGSEPDAGNPVAAQIDVESISPIVVTCNRCKTQFDGFAPGQANDCAADITGDEVRGFYGSSVADLTLLRFTQKPEGLGDGQICDACLTELLSRKVLIEVGEVELAGGVRIEPGQSHAAVV